MMRTLIILPDGTEVYSGTDGNTIKSTTFKQQVNSSKLLTLGSTCTAMLEVKLYTPDGDFPLHEGEEITVYRVTADDYRHLIGVFTLQKPMRLSKSAMRLTAYDRIVRLDKDLTEWLAELTGWPYSLLDLAGMVCEHCGLTLKNTTIPNGDYMVQKFSAGSITGRKVMQWVGEISGRFCRATPEGEIEFAWYEPSGVSITPDGDRFYYQNGLTYEDYSVAPIEKVQLKLTQDDVGVVWPDETGEKNTYIISGNYLLTDTGSSTLLPLAQTLYAQLKDVTYTPCKVVLPASLDIHAGQTVQITDRNGKTFTSYVMTKTQTGQRDTLECTGSQRRDSTTVVNNESYRALAGQILEVKKEMEGLSIKASKLENLEIGGRNLIRNSVNMLFADYGFASEESQNIHEPYTGTIMDKEDECAEFVITDTTDPFVLSSIAKPGEQYTFSFWARSDTGGSLTVSGTSVEIGAQWERHKITFTADSTDVSIFFGTAGTYYIYHPQLEIGSAMTDWTPAPEDIDESIAENGRDIESVRESVTQLSLDAEAIRASVSQVEGTISGVSGELEKTNENVAALELSATQFAVDIQTINEEGVGKISNTTGVFDKTGLTIDNTESPTKTTVTPDGMKVYRKIGTAAEEVLSATSDGVDATNLHAKTYLIVGGRSRFENYGSDQTGCFWIGE